MAGARFWVASWGCLGAPGGCLGASWGMKNMPKPSVLVGENEDACFWRERGRERGRERVGVGWVSRKPHPIRFLEASWSCLGSPGGTVLVLLGLSWGLLGPSWPSWRPRKLLLKDSWGALGDSWNPRPHQSGRVPCAGGLLEPSWCPWRPSESLQEDEKCAKTIGFCG